MEFCTWTSSAFNIAFLDNRSTKRICAVIRWVGAKSLSSPFARDKEGARSIGHSICASFNESLCIGLATFIFDTEDNRFG
ncbi:zinc finger mynd domain-containing protein [Moniliophthora roreri]|nr:zinc finger mynd domain-containing protein [Moniliophthora roreri]